MLLTTIQRYLEAMPCDSYRLQIVSFMGDSNPASFPAKFDILTSDEILKRAKYLSYRNWQGFNIYCRPNSTEYVLVDDLKREMLQLVSKFKPCVLMETSPENFQAFFRLRFQPNGEEEAKVICGEFTRTFDGDTDADNPMQPARLPGFTNRKAKHKNSDGQYPFVILHGAALRYTTFSPKGGACLTDKIDSAFNEVCSSDKSVRKELDRSREDFRIACNLIRDNRSDIEIFDVLINREKGRERGKSYVNFTIKNARRAVQKYH